MRGKKGEKGDISLITAITFAIFITALIALVVNFPIEQSFLPVEIRQEIKCFMLLKSVLKLFLLQPDIT